MSRRQLLAAKRSEQGSSSSRYVDLRLDVLEEDDAGRRNGRRLLSVGGCWDKLNKRYTDEEAKTCRVVTAHPGQIPFWLWIVAWLKAKVTGSERPTLDVVGKDAATKKRKVWVVLSHGGRRGGKTDSAIKAAIAYAILFPGSFVWLVSEDFPKTEELAGVLAKILPESWGKTLGAPNYVTLLVNGSSIHLRSAHNPDDLKRGRCDFCVLNEGSEISKRAFVNVRGGIADTGGLVVIAANPPDKPIGQWIFKMYERAKARRVAVKEFFFDPSKNPHVVVEALEDMADEIDRRTFDIEVRGVFLPRAEVVLYNYSTEDHEQPPGILDGRHLEDVTEAFTKRHFGRPFDWIVGLDFQSVPHMPAAIFKAYKDPSDARLIDDGADVVPISPTEPLLWVVDEIVLENAIEEDMISALLARGFDPKRTVLIGDASGDWQDAERTKGRGSFDAFRRAGFRFVYPPDPAQKRNPDRSDRFKVANARLRDGADRIHFYTNPDNIYSNTAMRHLDQKNGSPNHKSEYAHCVDAVTYVLFRFYPRRLGAGASRGVRYKAVESTRSGRAQDFEEL